MAGEVSKDISHRILLPSAVVKAHDAGEIHFHDMDYYAQHIPNCCLVNLDDMLQNGTVINKTLIEKPHSFATACNIATQIMAVVASGQYGGQSITLSHLAPFVDISRKKIRQEVIKEQEISGYSENFIEELTERRVKEEIRRGVQTIQYQINTLNTSNG
jgi:ribonucleoside-triphosphate reductase